MKILRPIAATMLTLVAAQVLVAKPSAFRAQAVPDTALLLRPFDSRDAVAFQRPPRIFYPETWFHFINGNVSRAGITRDLEAIAQAGITGVQLFHGSIGDSKDWPGTEEHIECLSPKWETLVAHTASEAHRLGLRFSLQTCPGWATSGGPWIKPEQAMRHLAYTRIDAAASEPIDSLLPTTATRDWEDWRDIVVLAFPTPDGDSAQPMPIRDVKALGDGNQQQWDEMLRQRKAFTLPPTDGEHPHRVTISLEGGAARSVVFDPIDYFNHAFGVQPDIHMRLFAADSSRSSKPLLETDFPHANWMDTRYGMTFALPPHAPGGQYELQIVNRHPMRLSRLQFFTAARANNWEAEAAWTLRTLLPSVNPLAEDPASAIPTFVRRDQLIDISSSLDAQGRLRWTPPATAARWTILRIGHINTGRRNGPAPAEATGWEVNKLDTAYVSFQFHSYIGRLVDGPLRGLVDNMLMDSWECNTQTWTRFMEREFLERCHYELRPWMPALFGFVVDDREQTSRFLSDWRRTINDLFVNNFYGHMARLAHERGLSVSFETAAGDIFPACPIEYYRHADVPMTEFWQPFSHVLANHNYKPIRPTASAARLYGKPRVTAEAFTSFDLNWDEHLSMLREVANQNMVEGVSHLVFHTYTHNPDADRFQPGSSFGGAIGTPFLRRQTWWWAMPRFTACMARCAFLLERGRPASHVLWYLGDEIQQKPDQYAPFPAGYSFDYLNTDALLHRLDVRDGLWTTPEGISYELLWIPVEHRRLLPQTLERLAQLVAKGGRLAAVPPYSIATLNPDGSPQWRSQYAASQIWSQQNLGRNVFLTESLEQALREAGIQPDVKADGLRWTHRRIPGADWYFVCPQPNQDFEGDVEFLQSGQAQLWNPVDGSVTPVAAQPDAAYSRLHLRLLQGQSLFVVFLHDGQPQVTPRWTDAQTLQPRIPWLLTFPSGWGITEPLQLNELKSWHQLPLSDEGRAFSGTATYETTLNIPNRVKGRRYMLRLGKVEEIALVEVNGHVCDTLWAPPYETDVTRYLRRGNNRLRLLVTNTWHNRLVFDAALPAEQRRTWVTSGPSGKSSLRPSGLLGPVQLVEQKAE